MPFDVRKPRFGKPKAQADGKAPEPCVAKIEARRGAMLKRAEDALPHLPGPGEAVHFLQTGYFDLMTLVPLLVSAHGKARHVRLATLSYNGRNLTEMVGLLDGGGCARLTLLTSTFFRNNNGALYRETCEELRGRGATVAAHKTHAKVVTLDFGGAKLSVEGSANLRSNRSVEQVMIARHAALHDWHAAWIDSFAADHQGDGAGADDGEEEVERGGRQGGPG
jgi:hypothetical protein